MPTTRPRHQITETPAVARALDDAAKRWPGESRSRLLVRLIDAGALALAETRREQSEHRRAVIQATSGKYTEAFPAGYLNELRQDWPE